MFMRGNVVFYVQLLCLLALLLCFTHNPGKKGNNAPLRSQSLKAAPAALPGTHAGISLPARALWQAQEARECAQGTAAKWQFAGPDNIGGRITDVIMPPNDTNTLYAAAASGGVFKSSDQGKTWLPLFDNEASLAVGSLAVNPQNPDILYAGTGEANAGGGSITYDGTGIYKSNNGGVTWYQTGLEETGSIARIAIDPRNPQRLFAAAMGKLFANNPERGLYRSTDSGKSWEKVLYLSEATGCADVAINPQNPKIVYAAMWERVRKPHLRKYGGNTCGIYRSSDGGTTWQKLTGGLPQNDLGRIGIAISAANPLVLYAVYANETGNLKGLYRTNNGGNSWNSINARPLYNQYDDYGWWFGNLRVHPNYPDYLYFLGLDLCFSSDGGKNWRNLSAPTVHMDQHALFIHPLYPRLMVLGNDGGVYLSNNAGISWQSLAGPPVIQFYTCESNSKQQTYLYGGTQDNGFLKSSNNLSNDWEILIDGDGMELLSDPANPKMLYAAYQYGNLMRSFDGGLTFLDATNGIEENDRKIWRTPFVIDPLQSNVLYYGANYLYKSTDHAVQWYPVSPDLSNGNNTGNNNFAAISAIAVAPSNNDMIYAGTDDGNLWVAYNNCTDWIDITAGLPEQWVSSIAVNPKDENTVFVAFSGYRQADFRPLLYKTNNAGITWKPAANNLPEAPVNKILYNPSDTGTVYIGTDTGVFYTLNSGKNWQILGANLPAVPVTDLCLQLKELRLVAATYGRGMFTFELGNTAAKGIPSRQ
ncbi:glycosyl hydrolase [Sphingobacteriales bacterium UPWRP_1]|nr:hypothetical protein BVG80_18065 [Sphingobacteriales bacterium TSM_CSM]PSJ73625.1 glycosyl hydrolase [Sphingobacteriales bacterium UPWRP_1]